MCTPEIRRKTVGTLLFFINYILFLMITLYDVLIAFMQTQVSFCSKTGIYAHANIDNLNFLCNTQSMFHYAYV